MTPDYPQRDLPSYLEGRYVPLSKVRIGKPQTYMVLGERCVIPWIHWLDDIGPKGHERPHFADREVCLGCIRGLRPRIKPVLACLDPATLRHCLLLLGRDTLRENRDLIPMHRVQLRGRRITVSRTGQFGTSPIRAQLSDIDKDSPGWPIGADELAVLADLWQVDESAIVLADSEG